MALRTEDLAELKIAFGEHDEPERQVASKLDSVIEGAAACVGAVAALSGDLVKRWNDSAALLERILGGLEGLRAAGERHAETVCQAHSEAARVMGILAESTDEARQGLEQQQPEMVRKMEALVASLSGRTAAAQDKADKAIDEWSETLADQQLELRDMATSAERASSGITEAMAAARAAMIAGVDTLTKRMAKAAEKTPVLFDFVERQVVAPALEPWAAAVKDVPIKVTSEVTALLAELTPPCADAGVVLAQRGAGIESQANVVCTRVVPAIQDLRARRGRIEAGDTNLVQARAPLPALVTACRQTAQEIGEPW